MKHRLAPMQSRSSRRGFTLLELIVVTVILVLLASMAVPRFRSIPRRTFDTTVEQTTDLLTMYALRESSSQKPVGVFHDAEAGLLTLVELDSGVAGGRSANWRIDPTVRPVKLPDMFTQDGVRAYENGEPYEISSWPLMSQPGQRRAAITPVLTAEGFTSTLTLPPYALSPQIVGDGRESSIARQPVDLDEAGRSREDW